MVTNIETCNFHCGKRPPEGGAYSITNKGIQFFFIKPVNVLIHCKFYKGKDFDPVWFHIQRIQRIKKTIGTTGNSHGWNWLATAKAYSPLMPAPPPDSSHFCFFFSICSPLKIVNCWLLYTLFLRLFPCLWLAKTSVPFSVSNSAGFIGEVTYRFYSLS